MSSEVGSAHISIFPVMTGFRSKVNKEVKSTGDEASNSFKSAFRNAGGISGRQLGKQLKESFAASSKGLAGDALKVFTDDVKAATNELSKARMKQADDAGRVRVAEMSCRMHRQVRRGLHTGSRRRGAPGIRTP